MDRKVHLLGILSPHLATVGTLAVRLPPSRRRRHGWIQYLSTAPRRTEMLHNHVHNAASGPNVVSDEVVTASDVVKLDKDTRARPHSSVPTALGLVLDQRPTMILSDL